MKILIVDTYYPQFLQSWQFNPTATPDEEVRRLLEFSFGTGDFYSRNLRTLGWETEDFIASMILLRPIRIVPDVVFMQDLSMDPPVRGRVLAGQLSCPWPGDHRIQNYDVIFTSFPHYIQRIEKLGVRAVYNPLAFDPVVLERVGFIGPRIHDCVFIGGVGAPSHWRKGMEILEAVAEAIPTFQWWGYGYETLHRASPLCATYQGEAWGLDMYRIFLRSKIVINRHGEVAEGYSNNQRLYEATGCGALLVTERSKNLHHLFDNMEVMAYSTADEAISIIESMLENDRAREYIAERGQNRTLTNHTYAERMQTVNNVLVEMQCPN